jgi:hypothetical protein
VQDEQTTCESLHGQKPGPLERKGFAAYGLNDAGGRSEPSRRTGLDVSPSVAYLRLLPPRLVRSQGEDIAHNPPRKKPARDHTTASSNSDERGRPSTGLWGSLVHPSGFGTPRRQFKSGQSHSASRVPARADRASSGEGVPLEAP